MMDIAGAALFHMVRDQPVIVSVIDTAEKIAAVAEAIEGMLEDGLIVISGVEMIRLVRAEVSDATWRAGETSTHPHFGRRPFSADWKALVEVRKFICGSSRAMTSRLWCRSSTRRTTWAACRQ